MSIISAQTMMDVVAEAERAHELHGESSIYRTPLNDRRFAVLTEEVGEVAKELNDYQIDMKKGETNPPRHLEYLRKLRVELIQVAAMAITWIEATTDAEAAFIEKHPETKKSKS